MTNRLAIVVALVLGILSILGIKAYVDRVQDDKDISSEKIPVFVAARDLEEGSRFTEDDLETASFPRGLLEQALQGTWVTEKQTIIDTRTKSRIKAGQILLTSHFERGTPKLPVRLQFLPSERAISISITPTGGLAGHLRPMDLVDVVISMNFTTTAGRPVQITTTLLKGVQILATGGNLDPGAAGSYSTLTLALSPEDMQCLLFAISQGASIQCALTMPDTPKGKAPDPMTRDEFWERVKPK